MGAPKRNRLKFEKPKDRWNLERIKADNSLVTEYGLKNMRELWKAQTEIGRVRRNARELLSVGGTQTESVKERMINRLTRIGITSSTATLSDLLDLKENALLERRLQTIVFKRGLARTVKQARQLTVHGFIAINGKRVNRPGYIVDVKDEERIGYYKPIDIMPKTPAPTAASAEEQPEQAEASAQQEEAPTAEKKESE